MKIQNFAGLALLVGTLMNVPAEAGYGRIVGHAGSVVVVPAGPGAVAGGAQEVRPDVSAVSGVTAQRMGLPAMMPGVSVAGDVNGAIGL